MEAMVPELEDYEFRGYFSKAEISAIVQRRQKFEYDLRRRNAQKEDFLRYKSMCPMLQLLTRLSHRLMIVATCLYAEAPWKACADSLSAYKSSVCRYYEYEWKLEQLRGLRRKERNIVGKRSLADYGIVRRIHFIFDRATRKFKGEMGMWMAWLKFCKDSDSKQQVSKVVTKALKLHPNAPYLWAYAAAWCVIDLCLMTLVPTYAPHSVARLTSRPAALLRCEIIPCLDKGACRVQAPCHIARHILDTGSSVVMAPLGEPFTRTGERHDLPAHWDTSSPSQR
jgi:hypothetical protein